MVPLVFGIGKRAKYLRLAGHEDIVYTAKFSLDGTQVVTASNDGTARVWQLESGQSQVLAGHEWVVQDAVFSPDGTQVVTVGYYDNTARVWNLETGESQVLAHEDAVLDAEFSPDGTQVLTASYDGTARIWDLQTGQFVSLDDHETGAYSAEFSPDGTRVVTGAVDWGQAVYLWNRQGQLLARFDGRNPIFGPEGQTIAVVFDGKAQVYDIETQKALIDWGCQ